MPKVSRETASNVEDIGVLESRSEEVDGTTIEFTSSSHTAPANAAEDVQRSIERSAGRLGLATKRMPSGAGHDAQMMARLSPMGMIFVPSVRGISHSPLETVTPADADIAARILLDVLQNFETSP